MNEVIELAKSCKLIESVTTLEGLQAEQPEYLSELQAFYEAAKAQGAKEFMESMGEPVLKVTNNGSQLSITNNDGGYWDMSKHIGEVFYALPNTKDEVK